MYKSKMEGVVDWFLYTVVAVVCLSLAVAISLL